MSTLVVCTTWELGHDSTALVHVRRLTVYYPDVTQAESVPTNASGAMTADQRRLVVAVCVISAAALLSFATMNYVIDPIVTDLGASEGQSSMLRQIPGIAGLLSIFIAGVLDVRYGSRRMLIACGVLMTAGYALTTIATVMPVLTLGLLLASVGRMALYVVAVSLLGAAIREPGPRASAFASYTMMTPAVCLVLPLIASVFVDDFGWRWVSAIWLLGGIAVVVVALRALPDDRPVEAGRASGELWTPAVAGIALVGVTQVVRLANADGLLSTPVLLAGLLTVVSGASLMVLLRRIPEPSLSLSLLKRGGIPLLIVVATLIPFANLSYYTTLGVQYLYGLSTLVTCLLLMPAQLFGVIGARLSAVLIRRRGLTFAGTSMLVALSVALASCAVVTTSTPVVVPAIILCLYMGFLAAAATPVINSVMDLAPAGEESNASAYQIVAGSLGGVLGVVMMSAVVDSAIYGSLRDQMPSTGMTAQQVEEVAMDMAQGATPEEASARYAIPIGTADQIQVHERLAMVEAYQAQGQWGAIVCLGAAATYYVNRRRKRRVLQPSVLSE